MCVQLGSGETQRGTKRNSDADKTGEYHLISNMTKNFTTKMQQISVYTKQTDNDDDRLFSIAGEFVRLHLNAVAVFLLLLILEYIFLLLSCWFFFAHWLPHKF